ncbi:MAG: DNA translocase FtsK [Bacillota bacterium]|nr:DNA translocase FtsK [Bacillota bacterium]
MRRELRAVAVIAVAVLVLLTLHSSPTGLVGRNLAYGLRWLLGDGTTAAAFLVILLNLRSLLGEASLAAPKRWGFLLLWLALAAGLSLPLLLEGRLAAQVGVADAVRLAEQGRGGGIVGSLVACILLRLLDGVGTQVVLGAVALAGVILLTTARGRQTFWRFLRGLLGLAWQGVAALARWSGGAVVWLAGGLISFFAPDAPAEDRQEERRTVAPSPVKPARAEPPARPEIRLPSFSWGAPKDREQGGAEAAREEEGEAPTIRAYAPPLLENHPAARTGEEADRGGAVHGAQLALLSGQAVYQLPPLSLLSEPVPLTPAKQPVRNLTDQARLLEETLDNFGVKAKVVHIDQGPVVTRFELQPAPGVKVSRIVSLADDIALSLAAADVRIEAPIPGKAAVGIEVPNKEVALVHLREVLAAPEFDNPRTRLPLALGKDIAGVPIVCDLVDMPHLLIAGATGSGKSVCLNTMIASILYRLRPNEVKMLMIDPKRVELTVYDGIPHLLAPVVTDPKRAAVALKWVVEEMEKRYELFASSGVRSIDKYNALIARAAEEAAATTSGTPGGEGGPAPAARPLPGVIVFIDELADLMMVAAAEVEDSICRLAQMARAAGIHLVIATQRPSVDVITGLIKANIPSRIAFAVSSQVDSRTILDMAGAERLLGKGDMLFCPVGAVKPLRVQGAYITDREVEALVEFWKRQGRPEYQADLGTNEVRVEAETGDDELYDDAVKLVVSTGNASISMIQRRFRIGYARAARLIDMMELAGIVGPYQGSKPREVLVSPEDEG